MVARRVVRRRHVDRAARPRDRRPRHACRAALLHRRRAGGSGAVMAAQPPPRQLLLGRKVEVRVAVPLKDYVKVGSLVLTVTDLRVQFKIKKTTKKEPNTAEITITNLNPEHRAQLQTQGGKFILLAGYESTGVEQLFVGD